MKMPIEEFIAFVVIIIILAFLYDCMRDIRWCLKGILKSLRELKKGMESSDEEDDPDDEITLSLKRLIAERCLAIENELVRLRYSINGERNPGLDKVNILDTLVDIKAAISTLPVEDTIFDLSESDLKE